MSDSYYYSYFEKDSENDIRADLYRDDNAPGVGEFITCNEGVPYKVVDVTWHSQFKDYNDHGSDDDYFYTVTVEKIVPVDASGNTISEEEMMRIIDDTASTMFASGEVVAQIPRVGGSDIKIYMDIHQGLLSLYDSYLYWIDGIDLKVLLGKLMATTKEQLKSRLRDLMEILEDVHKFKKEYVKMYHLPYASSDMEYSGSSCNETWTVSEGVKEINRFTFVDRDERNPAFRLYSKVGGKTFREIRHCTKTVVLPASLEEIGYDTFMSCESLEQVRFSSGCELKKIGQVSFFCCFKLKELSLPDSLITIGNQAFYRCVSLERVRFGKRVKEIGSHAFQGCMKLREITIHDNIDFDYEVFSGCSGLEVINIQSSGAKDPICDFPLELSDIDKRYPNLKLIVIDKSLIEKHWDSYGPIFDRLPQKVNVVLKG